MQTEKEVLVIIANNTKIVADYAGAIKGWVTLIGMFVIFSMAVGGCGVMIGMAGL